MKNTKKYLMVVSKFLFNGNVQNNDIVIHYHCFFIYKVSYNALRKKKTGNSSLQIVIETQKITFHTKKRLFHAFYIINDSFLDYN